MYPLQGKWILLSVLSAQIMLHSPPSLSANQGRGEVAMNGRIIDSACAIDTESIDQTIKMATLPVSQIMRDGQSNRQKFSIKLINCVLEKLKPGLNNWRYFEVTFDGREDGGNFGIDGSASGIALQISDEGGNVATPGLPMNKKEIHAGEMTFNYGLRLVGNRRVLKAGEYSSTVRFKIDYY
ncbi:MAG: fimbrial protein [Serratia proteamaculans]